MSRISLLPWLILAVACGGSSNDEIESPVQQCTLDAAGDVCTAPSHSITASADEASAPAVDAGVTYAITGPSAGKHGYVVFTATATGTHTLYFGDAKPVRVCDEQALCASAVTDCGDFHRAAQYALMQGEHYVIELKPSAADHPFRLHIVAPEAPPPPPPGGLQLGPRMFYPSTGTFSRDISVGDLDGDGAPDVVVSNPDDAGGATYLDILRNDGSGAFVHVARVMTSVPRETVIADFDGDGDNDIAGIASDGMGPLPNFFLRNDRNFTFTKITWTPTLQYKGTLSGGDFDEDGIMDLVAVYVPGDADNRSGFVITKMPGLATLQEQDEFAGATSAAIAGDFNGDGHQDVVVGSKASPTVRLWLGDGTGRVTFEREVTLPLNMNITKLVALNLEGNGNTDFAAFGTGVDGFGFEGVVIVRTSAAGFAIESVPFGAEGIAAGDFDHDNLIDLVTGVPDAAADPDLTWYRGIGTSFGFAGTIPGGRSNCCMVATDLDNDGVVDLVTRGSDGVMAGIDVFLGTR